MDTVKELSLKLVIDTKDNRVLFAEAEKDVIDFLFSLLILPVSSIIELVTKQNMVGCIANLYGSDENIGDTYLQENLDKNILLKPKSVLSTGNIPLLPPSVKVKETRTKREVLYYKCFRYKHNFVTTSYGAACPSCHFPMKDALMYVAGNEEVPKKIPSKGELGYVKEMVTYMVSDDLVVVPMCTISMVTILKQFHVENLNSIQEKTVKFGVEEGLELLKASMQSRSALTKVFLHTKVKPEPRNTVEADASQYFFSPEASSTAKVRVTRSSSKTSVKPEISSTPKETIASKKRKKEIVPNAVINVD